MSFFSWIALSQVHRAVPALFIAIMFSIIIVKIKIKICHFIAVLACYPMLDICTVGDADSFWAQFF